MSRTTNIEFITEVMDYSRNGALMQAFILEGIGLYAKDILRMKKKPEGWPDFISFEAWYRCAEEMIEKLDERYSKAVIEH